jgi:beta-lactamase class A
LPGKTAVYVATDGVEVAAHGADEPLAVGSTFKLAILAALRDAIGAGTLAPETVVTLKDEWKSAPTGVLQTWPAGTPLTIAALALEMISISDNTATDALIDIVGRDAIAAKTPRNTPLLKTAEIFKLNAPANAALLAAWQAGDAEARTALLADLAALPLPSAGDITGSPAVAEWFMTAREACVLMEQVADEPAMRVNPGVAERADWQAIAYKGGSNTGVLNFTTRVIGRDGRTHCMSATWNGAAPLDMAKLATPYRGILRALR